MKDRGPQEQQKRVQQQKFCSWILTCRVETIVQYIRMRTALWVVAALAAIIVVFYVFNSSINQQKHRDNSMTAQQEMLPIVTPVSHATMVLDWGGTIIYTDPTGVSEAFASKPAANIVLVTDIHGDHFSTSTIEAVVGENTTLIVPQAVANRNSSLG